MFLFFNYNDYDRIEKITKNSNNFKSKINNFFGCNTIIGIIYWHIFSCYIFFNELLISETIYKPKLNILLNISNVDFVISYSFIIPTKYTTFLSLIYPLASISAAAPNTFYVKHNPRILSLYELVFKYFY
jgi:hypothetical protein